MAKGTVNVGPPKAQDVSEYLKKTGDGSNVTASFTAATTRANIATGEKMSVIFGKLAKWFADLKTVAFSGSYNDLSDKPTIPAAVTVDTALSSSSTNPVQNKVIKSALDGKADSSHNHDASTISSGTFDAARIPTLAASKVTSGTFAAPDVKAMTGTDYTTYRVRNAAIVSATPSSMSNGDVAFVYS